MCHIVCVRALSVVGESFVECLASRENELREPLRIARTGPNCMFYTHHCHTCDDITHGHAHPTPTRTDAASLCSVSRLRPPWRDARDGDLCPLQIAGPSPLTPPADYAACASHNTSCAAISTLYSARAAPPRGTLVFHPQKGAAHAPCSGAAPSLPSGRCGRSPAMMMTHAMPDSRRMRHAHSQPRNSMTRAHTHTHGRSGNSARVSSHHHLAVPLLPPSIHLHVPRCGPLHALSRGVAH